jgi:hypothetical protein
MCNIAQLNNPYAVLGIKNLDKGGAGYGIATIRSRFFDAESDSKKIRSRLGVWAMVILVCLALAKLPYNGTSSRVANVTSNNGNSGTDQRVQMVFQTSY